MASPVPNCENTQFTSGKKAAECGRKGGYASGESKRRAKQLKDDLITLLETGDTQNNICLEQIKKALDGDTRAFEVIRDTIGEKPTDKIEGNVNVSYEQTLKEVADTDEY